MFTLAFLLASWLSMLGLLAGQLGLAGFGAVLLGVVAALRLLVRQRRRVAADHRQAVGAARSDPSSAIDPDLLRDALRLCHPDAHPPERSQLANEVTARLTELRRRQG